MRTLMAALSGLPESRWLECTVDGLWPCIAGGPVSAVYAGMSCCSGHQLNAVILSPARDLATAGYITTGPHVYVIFACTPC